MKKYATCPCGNKVRTFKSRARKYCSHICYSQRVITDEHRKKLSNAQKLIGNKPPSPIGVKHTAATKKKIGEAQKGKLNHNWKGGVTPYYRLVRSTPEYYNWRKMVFERDRYTCVHCGIHNHVGLGKTVSLQADHIKPLSTFPELIHDVSNGRTLCIDCHKKTETYGGKLLKGKKKNHVNV